MQSSPVISLSPSFNSYSSSRLAEIAARVVQEFRAEADDDGGGGGGGGCSYDCCNNDEVGLHFRDKLIIDEGNISDKNGDKDEKDEDKEEAEEEEFEFAVVGRDFVLSPTPADEIFYNGQIRPCFPLFNQDLLLEGVEGEKEKANLSDEKVQPQPPPAAGRLSLRKLFIEDREPPSSCSSSEADELEGLPPGSYCMWSPKTAAVAAAAEEGRCKKSNSTGSSKRWKIRDLLHRSNSDGKDSFVFLTSSGSRNAKKREGKKFEKIEKSSAAVAPEVPKAAGRVAPAAVYVKNDGERRRMSFLPYRQDLVVFFSNVNGMGRNLHPF